MHGSVFGVAVSGLVILFTHWALVDPLISFVVVAAILKGMWPVLKESVGVLMESAPRGLDTIIVQAAIKTIPGVKNVHGLHLWAVKPGLNMLTCHIMVEHSDLSQEVLTAVRRKISQCRTFLQAASFLFPLMLFNPFAFFKSLFAPEGELRPIKQPRVNPFVREGKVLVGIVKGENIQRMVRECVDLIGGIEKIGVRGKTILVKPNVVAGDSPPTTTNPEVVKSVVQLLYEAKARKVIVGDMYALLTQPTKRNLEKTGIEKAAREAGAEVIDFDDVDWIELRPPGARLVPKIHIAKPVYEAEVLINVPVVKTHRSATYSICLKNLVGVTHPCYRPYRVDPAQWEKVVVEINLAVHPDLHIVDATTCMVAGGPWKGTAMKTGMIIASGDRIAADVVGLGLIKSFGKWEKISKVSVWEQQQIRYARELGLGIPDKEAIQIVTKLLEGDENEFSNRINQIKDSIRA